MKYSVLFAAVLLAGCGSAPPEEKKAAATPPPVEYFHVDPATAGSLHGKILYKGPMPKREPIDMNAEAACKAEHAGKPAYDESMMVSKDGSLANAFVYIKSGLEGKKFEPVSQPATLDQHGCMFTPRVIGLSNAQVLSVQNSDGVAHNVHPLPKNNHEWNEEQAPKSEPVQHKFARTEVMIAVKCNIHSWMRAYIGIVENPYFAVTGPDGSFELKNMPPGDYTIAVWHEKLGEQTQQVHVAASSPGAVNFTYP